MTFPPLTDLEYDCLYNLVREYGEKGITELVRLMALDIADEKAREEENGLR
jgi:hypothetical protein